MYSLGIKTLLFLALAAMTSASFNNENKQFDCPADENFYTCSLLKCPSSCNHVDKPCPYISEGCYQPACECMDGYLRNENGKCVPEKGCFDLYMQHRTESEDFSSVQWENIDLDHNPLSM